MAEDLNLRRMLAARLVRTNFRKPWQYRVEIHPPQWAVNQGRVSNALMKSIATGNGGNVTVREFDLYCKDVTYGPVEIETEQIKLGAVTLTFPVASAPVGISTTMRDNDERIVYKWFKQLAGLVLNDDGTVNLAYGARGYLCVLRMYALTSEGETLSDEMLVMPTQMGDCTESQDGEGFTEFPCQFIQFRSLGA